MTNAKTVTLINFRSEKSLVDAFDKICRFYGSSRTAVLISFMRAYVSREIPRIDQANKLRDKLDKTINEASFDPEQDDPPRFFSSREFERDFSDEDMGRF